MPHDGATSPLTGVVRPQSGVLIEEDGTVVVRVVAYGQPVPQGSKRAFALKTGKINMVESSKSLPAWRNEIMGAAADVVNRFAEQQEQPVEHLDPWLPLQPPLATRIAFTRNKPKSAPKRKTTYPTQKPDLDKLVRAALDPFTILGVFPDDANVTAIHAEKLYPGESSAFPRGRVDGCPTPFGGLCVDMRCGCFWMGLPVPGMVAEIRGAKRVSDT